MVIKFKKKEIPEKNCISLTYLSLLLSIWIYAKYLEADLSLGEIFLLMNSS